MKKYLSRSFASTRFRVDEDSGSGEHGSRPQTSRTPGRASADPISAYPVWQWTGDSSKESTGSGVRVIWISDKPDIQDSRGSLNPSSGSGMSECSRFSLVNDIPSPQHNLPLLVRSDRESSDETVTGHFVSTKKSVKQSGGTGHLEKSRGSGKSIQSDELGQPGSTVLADKPVHTGNSRRSGETIQLASSRHCFSSGQSSVSVHSGKSGKVDKSGWSVPLGQSTKSRQPKIAHQDDSHHQAIDPSDHTDGMSSDVPHTVSDDSD